MQDFTKYNYELNIDDIIKAQQDGREITVIINGEYYSLKDANGGLNNDR